MFSGGYNVLSVFSGVVFVERGGFDEVFSDVRWFFCGFYVEDF